SLWPPLAAAPSAPLQPGSLPPVRHPLHAAHPSRTSVTSSTSSLSLCPSGSDPVCDGSWCRCRLASDRIAPRFARSLPLPPPSSSFIRITVAQPLRTAFVTMLSSACRPPGLTCGMLSAQVAQLRKAIGVGTLADAGCSHRFTGPTRRHSLLARQLQP